MAIQLRRGTNAQWEALKGNIVVGELATTTDTERAFLGTGNGTYFEMANIDLIGDEFDSSATYAEGDVCIYQGKLYQFTSAHNGAWTGSDVEQISLASTIDGTGDGLTDEIKQALLQIASKVAYIDADGQTYYDALYDALYPPTDLVSISAVYTQSGTVYDTDSLDSLKADLVVTATYSDSTTETVPSTDYTLSGTLTVGTSTITVAYGGKTTTFTVAVTHYDTSLYNWDFTQSLVDSKQSAEITLGTGWSQDSNGLKATNSTTLLQAATIDLTTMGQFTIELDITSFAVGGNGNWPAIFFSYQANQLEGVMWRISSALWAIRDFTNTYYDISGTTLDMFTGKTMKLQVDFDISNTYKLYADDVLVHTQSVSIYGKRSAIIGMRGYNALYTGLRIYEGLV